MLGLQGARVRAQVVGFDDGCSVKGLRVMFVLYDRQDRGYGV